MSNNFEELKRASQQALDALEYNSCYINANMALNAIRDLRQALAALKQVEPPTTQFVGLTPDERKMIIWSAGQLLNPPPPHWMDAVFQGAEDKMREKNATNLNANTASTKS